MYKVMVVDDEPIVRLAVKSLVDWRKYGFNFQFEASNGKQALNILRNNKDIDIIITDINMPVLNGLDFISEIKKLGKSPESIIVLSAYDDYNLVRESFKLGVNDYILKINMNPKDILNLLKNTISKLKDTKSTNSDFSTKYLKDNFFKNLLLQNNISNIKKSITKLGIRLNEKNIVICFLWIDDYNTVADRYDNNSLKSFISSVVNAIYQVLNNFSCGECISLSPEEYVILLSFNDVSMLQIHKKLTEILENIRYSLSNYINISISIGVSSILSGFEHIPKLYQQSEKNARFRFIYGKGRTIFPKDVYIVPDKHNQKIIGNEKDFVSALKEIDDNKVFTELNKLLHVASNFNPDSMEKMYSSYMKLIFIILKFLNDVGENCESVFGEDINFYEKIKRFETQEEINTWIKNITAWVLNFFKQKENMKVNSSIRRAQKFIKENYSSDITLKMISDYVGLSESHLSFMFTKEIGQTFIQYLTHIRIEKAKKLLTTTNMKIYEISEKVGYVNVEHFSRVFKKVAGISPHNYKSKIF